jgi:hypothetical protein
MERGTVNWAVVLLLMGHFGGARAQTYRLRSLEGPVVSVQVNSKPVNYNKNSHQGRCYLSVVHGTDTVFVYDAWANGTVKVLNQQFLQFDYPVRGGTNVGLGSTLVVCVANGKLCQTLKLPTYLQTDLYSPDYHELYKVRLRLSGNTSQTYQFHLATHNEIRSERDPTSNHNSTTQDVLKFDAGRLIFYSGFRRVPALFPVVDEKMEQVVTLRISEPLPVIKWNNCVQYFIKNEWYGASRTEK